MIVDALGEAQLVLAGAVGLERRHGRGAQGDRAAALGGLGPLEGEAGLGLLDRLAHREGARGEVEIAPALPEQLAAAQAGRDRDQNRYGQSIAGCGGEQGDGLDRSSACISTRRAFGGSTASAGLRAIICQRTAWRRARCSTWWTLSTLAAERPPAPSQRPLSSKWV